MADQAPKRRRVTLTEVATELGVAPSTVSNAYNRPDQLSAALRERVLATAARLGYSGPDAAARTLRRGRANTIGVLYTNHLSYAFTDPAAVLFLQGVAIEAEAAGLGLLLIPAGTLAEQGVEAIGAAVVDGFVIYSMGNNDPLTQAALDRRLPTVIVDQPQNSTVPWVGINDQGAARSAAEHLLALGHRRFGIVTFRLSAPWQSGLVNMHEPPEITFRVSQARMAGYAEALEAAGLSWRSVPVYECAASAPAAGATAAEILLAQQPRPTALLVISDQLALGCLQTAQHQGLVVPDDVSIVGFDDIPAAAQQQPPLTTIHQPHIAKGREAGRLVIAGLRGEPVTTPDLLPTRLIIRGTTAPPRDEN